MCIILSVMLHSDNSLALFPCPALAASCCCVLLLLLLLLLLLFVVVCCCCCCVVVNLQAVDGKSVHAYDEEVKMNEFLQALLQIACRIYGDMMK